MDAPQGSCSFCGQRAVNHHHLTGRHPDGSYLHPELTAELCHRHHVLVHNDLRTFGIDVPDCADSGPALLAVFALRRVAVFIGRLADCLDNPLWKSLALMLESVAAIIRPTLIEAGRA